MLCRSLFVLLYFFFWPLYCLFLDVRTLIIPLVSSNLFLYTCVIISWPLKHAPQVVRIEIVYIFCSYSTFDLSVFYCQIYTIGLNTSFTTYMKFSPLSYKHRSDREDDG